MSVSGNSTCVFFVTGNSSAAEYYAEQLEIREETFDEIFWDESTGTWRDYDTTTSKHSVNSYLSSVAPLVWGCGPSNTSKQLSTLRYLQVLVLLFNFCVYRGINRMKGS